MRKVVICLAGSVFAIGFLFGLGLWASPACASEHRLYLGINWNHLSNLDAGEPFNGDRSEFSADHYGVKLEYQYGNDHYFYFSGSIGNTKFNGSHRNWHCSGCDYPAALQAGFNWRLF